MVMGMPCHNIPNGGYVSEASGLCARLKYASSLGRRTYSFAADLALIPGRRWHRGVGGAVSRANGFPSVRGTPFMADADGQPGGMCPVRLGLRQQPAR
jgi:hypothetical protein